MKRLPARAGQVRPATDPDGLHETNAQYQQALARANALGLLSAEDIVRARQWLKSVGRYLRNAPQLQGSRDESGRFRRALLQELRSLRERISGSTQEAQANPSTAHLGTIRGGQAVGSEAPARSRDETPGETRLVVQWNGAVGKKMGTRYDWDPLLDYALGEECTGDLKERHGALTKAIRAGVFPGVTGEPDYTSFWRQARKRERNQPRRAAADAQGEIPSTALTVALGGAVQVLDPSSAATAKAVRELEKQVHRMGYEIHTVFMSVYTHFKEVLGPADIRAYRDIAQRVEQWKELPALPVGEHREQAIRDRTLALQNLTQAASAFLVEYRGVWEDVRLGAADEAEPLELVQVGRNSPTWLELVYGTTAVPAWDSFEEGLLTPGYREIVGRTRSSITRQRAAIRASAALAVVSRSLSPGKVAEALHRYARGEATEDDKVVFGDLPLELVREYYNVGERAIYKWAKRVRDATERARLSGSPAPSAHQVLEHRQPVESKRQTKRTPELIQRVEKRHLALVEGQGRESGAGVHRLIRDEDKFNVSERLVQKIIAEDISDTKRLLGRGGVSAEPLILRSRLLRHTPQPNAVWIFDHSFIQHEHVSLAHPEYQDLIRPAEEFEVEYRVERRNFHGVWKLERRYGLYVSAIIDACTRFVVGFRVWDRVPDTWMTLSLLFDAISKYGAPNTLYTDNGSDFRSQLMREVLHSLGIQRLFSLPYSPQGRAKVERWFRSLKEMVMPGITGFVGGRGTSFQLHIRDLLAVEEIEKRMWLKADRLLNYEMHSRTKRVPAHHYEAELGARYHHMPEPRDLLRLLPREERIRHTWGVEVDGLPYWTPKLSLVPVGSLVSVHKHPARWETVHLSAIDSMGDLRYLGPARFYDSQHLPPEIGELRKMEGSLRAYFDHLADEESRDQLGRAREAAIEVVGEEVAGTIAEVVEKQFEQVSAGDVPRLLPAAASPEAEPPEAGEVLPSAAHNQAEPAPRASAAPGSALPERTTKRPRRSDPAVRVDPFQ